jgi:hypothetical protein
VTRTCVLFGLEAAESRWPAEVREEVPARAAGARAKGPGLVVAPCVVAAKAKDVGPQRGAVKVKAAELQWAGAKVRDAVVAAGTVVAARVKDAVLQWALA